MPSSYGFQQYQIQTPEGPFFQDTYARAISQEYEAAEVSSFTEMLKEDDRDSGYYASDSSSYEHNFPPTSNAPSYQYVPRTLTPDMNSIQASANFFDAQEFGSDSTGSPAVPSASHSIASIQSTQSSPYHGAVENWNNGDYMRPSSSWGLDNSAVFIDPNLIPHSPREEPISAISAHAHSFVSRSQSPSSPHLSRHSTERVTAFTTGDSYAAHYPTSHPITRQPTDTLSEYDSNSSTIAAHDDKRSKSPSSDKGSSKDQPCPECGKKYRDLKAHMLTHQRERPEKCPISTCEYSTKGFARKYDCQRHTLTHYKGTMVCGFCPGSGSAAEKSFNRADVFKRHIASVHNAEQSPSNNRKKSPNGTPRSSDNFNSTGRCSTCDVVFATAQQFYEHVDECVYTKIIEVDPATVVNEKNLESIKMEDIDPDLLGSKGEGEEGSDIEDEDMEYDEAELAEDEARDEKWTLQKNSRSPFAKNGARNAARKNILSRINGNNKVNKAKRFTRTTSCRGKKRKSFPHSWGATPEKMTTKRRCLFVYDGSNELIRDEMVMHSDMEVKTSIAGKFQVSDLDYWTMERANAAIQAAPGPEDY